jgi:two-component system CheB/CheR fusion protein
MAVVVIQHLDPKHGSLTTDILSRTSPMPVAEAVDGIPVEPDHIYVIPPNRMLRILGGVLKLSPRIESRGQHLPINVFFQSLADDRKNQAIGVVLSGIATDGTVGLSAIKKEGGLTFAQDPKTAQYDGMPRSAIFSGAVDIVETPKGIAEEIGRISHLFPLQSMSAWLLKKRGIGHQGHLQKTFAIIRTAAGIDFTYYKQSTILRRIARRQFVLKIPDLQNYVRYLADHPEEVKTLVDEFLIQVTSFFRDPEAFEFLKTHILPKYMTDWDESVPLRIWVPGCSTGEEAYSIAMIFFEFREKAKVSARLQVFASDISELAIQKARMGVYPEVSARTLPKAGCGVSLRKRKKDTESPRRSAIHAFFRNTTSPPIRRLRGSISFPAGMSSSISSPNCRSVSFPFFTTR